jgi:DNA gyrase subunit B
MAEPAYTAKDITVLEGLEPVRLRPGMYIGSTGTRGFHQLVYEVVDNAVDEALGGHNDYVEVRLHPDNSATVIDHGRGIPVDIIPEQGLPALTVVLTTLHAGGKFGGEGYKVSGGLHGVGISVVNALSERLTAEVRRDGKIYRQEFERGEPTGDMQVVGESDESGTTIWFLPDSEVFEESEFEFSAETLVQRLRETAFLTAGLRIVLLDEREGDVKHEFHYEGGIRDFVRHVNASKDAVHKHIVYFEGTDERNDGSVEVAMQWNNSFVDSVYSFANNINTHEGGSHLSGFRRALTGTLNDYGRRMGLLKEKDEEKLEGEDVREGLAAVISVKLRTPQFEGQTKTKLGNPWVDGHVTKTVNERLGQFLEENPTDARQIIQKAIAARNARQAARKARDLTRRKSALENSSLPGKLAEHNRINKVLSNTEIQAMITAIGTGIGDEFDIAKLRYHKVIVMTDADVDGSHIRTLILTFLYRNMRELVERGHIHIAVPPLYRVKLGNQELYVEKESQFEDLLVRERVKDMVIVDRTGKELTLTETRYARFGRALHEFEGWLQRLRADFGGPAADFVVAHRIVETEAAVSGDISGALSSIGPNGYEVSIVDGVGEELRLKVIERETSAASFVTLPAALLASPAYAALRRSYVKLADITGNPPFRIDFGKKTRVATTFESLRSGVLELAKEGMQVSRFKGLGEMNASELRETTMEKGRRMLIQVEVEDATRADEIFSKLMGDQVEPRRLFIEQNAKDVRFLDV